MTKKVYKNMVPGGKYDLWGKWYYARHVANRTCAGEWYPL